MSNVAAANTSGSVSIANDDQLVEIGRSAMLQEANSVVATAEALDVNFAAAVRLIYNAPGDVIISGMGKAGHVGRKLAATFTSTGTRSHFLHPAEAMHGDLGAVRSSDVAILFSQSGETSEVLDLFPALQRCGAPIVAVTATTSSSLGRQASIVLPIGRLNEACSLGLAPSTSTTVMLAIGDALAIAVSRLRGFRKEDFARYHPGGSLGLKLSFVDDHMRPLAECRTADERRTVRDVFVASTQPGRRSGAVMLTNDAGRLVGLFTDSDLSRLIENRQDYALDQPIRDFMTKAPTTVLSGQQMHVALDLLAQRKFSELPVVDSDGRPVGIIDVTDVLDIHPTAGNESQRSLASSDNAGGVQMIRIYSGEENSPASSNEHG